MGLEVVDVLHRKASHARRQRVVPVVVRYAQGALKIDLEAGICADIGKAEHQRISVHIYRRGKSSIGPAYVKLTERISSKACW